MQKTFEFFSFFFFISMIRSGNLRFWQFYDHVRWNFFSSSYQKLIKDLFGVDKEKQN